MLTKLRYKFTCICTFTTSIVLLTTMIVLFLLSKEQLDIRYEHDLDSQLNLLIHNIQNSYSADHEQYSISYSWLSQLESMNHLVIQISENNKPFHYKGSFTTQTERQTLLEDVTNLAVQDYDYNFLPYYNTRDTVNSIQFHLRLSRLEHYLVNISTFSLHYSNMQIILLKDMKEYDQTLHYQGLLYTLIFFVATLLLSLFSYWFAGRVILPIAENEKEQKEFIAAASHELRSPLAVLTTNTSALSEEYPIIKSSSFFSSINLECQRMTRLLNDLSLLSHADTKINWSLEPKLTEIDTLLLEIYDTFYQTAHNTGHNLSLQLPDTVIYPCKLDAERLTQAISILINNAISYTPEGSTITLSLLPPKAKQLCICIVDDGPGIDDAHKPYIFKRFYRVDESRHKKEHFGLGLSIAYEIINLHGGQLTLEDTMPHGCTFKIVLPIHSS